MNRLARRSLLLLAALVMSLTAVSAAFAESEWRIFDTVCDLTGPDAAKNGDLVMQRDLYQGVVDGMEFAVTEAGYDGMALFLRYTYRMPKVEYHFGVTAAEVYGDELPEGVSPDSYVEGLVEERRKPSATGITAGGTTSSGLTAKAWILPAEPCSIIPEAVCPGNSS